MGFRISLIAAKDMPAAELCKRLGFVTTSEPDEANEAPFSVAELPNGWSIFWSNDPSYARIAICEPLSRHAEVVSCWVNETAMFSSANFFQEGKYVGFVGHNGASDFHSLEEEGRLPDGYEVIRDSLITQHKSQPSDEIDFLFDIPVETAALATGFRYDRTDYDWGTPAFYRAERRQPGLIARLFGG